jgi:hypothetical protein
MEMPDVTFINYRREDSASEAKLIANEIADLISPEAFFMDSTTINYGDPWPDRIQAALLDSRYVLVVIGPEWLKVGMNEWGQRRIDDASDWVRQEIATALSDSNKTIIPLLVRSARMPPPDVLPDDIAGVSSKQAIELRSAFWDHDITLVTSTIYPDVKLKHSSPEIDAPNSGDVALHEVLKLLQGFLQREDVTSEMQNSEQQARIFDARLAVERAANHTRSYIANRRRGVRDPNNELELSDEWTEVGDRLRAINIPKANDLYEICFRKARYWSDTDGWNDSYSGGHDISLENVVDIVQEITAGPRAG